MPSQPVPNYPLSKYILPAAGQQGVFVGRFEVLNARLNRPSGAHRHGHHELFWLRGPAVHENDFGRFELPGDRPSFVFVSAGQLHAWSGADDIRGVLISFTTEFFDGREPPPSALLGHGFVHRAEYSPCLVADAEFAREAEPLIALCEREYAGQAGHWEAVVRSSLRSVLALASRAYARHAPHATGGQGSHRLLRDLRVRVEERFKRDSSVAAYARALGVTPGHLNDTVREFTGETAGKLIRDRIFLEARRLLAHSELSVSEVAYELGFADPSYFAKAFRREAGCPPAEFRARFLEKHPGSRD